jgi:hypothetical protein
MIDLGPEPEPQPAPQYQPQEAKPASAPFLSESEKMRQELAGVLAINLTSAEAEAWIQKNFGPEKGL